MKTTVRFGNNYSSSPSSSFFAAEGGGGGAGLGGGGITEDTLGIAGIPVEPTGLGVEGLDGGVPGLLTPDAASIALPFKSLSPPANMIPERVPVKKVAIGIINSKNLESIGAIAFIGCVTKMREYNTTNTIPTSVSARQIPIKNFSLAINCSSVYMNGS